MKRQVGLEKYKERKHFYLHVQLFHKELTQEKHILSQIWIPHGHVFMTFKCWFWTDQTGNQPETTVYLKKKSIPLVYSDFILFASDLL